VRAGLVRRRRRLARSGLLLTILVVLALLGCLTLVVLRRPAAALGGALCTYGLEQYAQAGSGLFIKYHRFINYATAALMLLGLATLLTRGRLVVRRPPAVFWAITGLYVLALCSTAWSVYPQGSTEQWVRLWPYIGAYVLLAPLLIIEPPDLKTALVTVMVMGSIILLLLLLTTPFVGRMAVLKRGVGIGALVGEYGNPLALASLGGYIALVAAMMNFQGLRKTWQVLRWVIVGLGLVVAIRTGSRGQLFAILTAGIMFLPMSRRIRTFRGFVAVLFGIALLGTLALWAHDVFAERERWRWDTMVEAWTTGRLGTAMTLLKHWADSDPFHWVFGLGSSASFSPSLLGFYPHLVMAEVLAEEGLIGFVLLWAIFLLAMRSLVRLYRIVAPFPDARGLLAAIGALFMFGVILSFKEGSFLGNTESLTFALVLGYFEIAVKQHQAQAAVLLQWPAAVPGAPPATAILSA
jgi:hypothetical protein